jgi:hypothetical protein
LPPPIDQLGSSTDGRAHIVRIAGGIAPAKLAPAGIGAAIMVLVDPPANKRELFLRVFVAFAASYLLGDVVFDMLHSTAAFAFLDHAKRAHTVAIDGLVGALGLVVLRGGPCMAAAISRRSASRSEGGQAMKLAALILAASQSGDRRPRPRRTSMHSPNRTAP